MNRALSALCLVLCACTASPTGTTPSGEVGEALKGKKGDYRFSRVVTLGDPDPGGPPGSTIASYDDGGYMLLDGINNDGEVLFDALVDTTWVEAMFSWKKGVTRPVLRGGDAAPGATTFSGWGSLGRPALDDDGNVLLPWTLDPVDAPYGPGAGAWYYDAEKKKLSAVIVPGVTKVPGRSDTFLGVDWDAALSKGGRGAISGIVPAPDQDLAGVGVFTVSEEGKLRAVVVPGDSDGNGGTFDQAWHGWANDHGDVAFGGHIVGEECVGYDPTFAVHCFESLYLKDRHSTLTSIAHQGEPAPGGGTYRIAWGANLNNSGDILYVGDLSTPPDVFQSGGLFVYSGGAARPLAVPGDVMPGGGTLQTVGGSQEHHIFTNSGEAVFLALVDGVSGIYSFQGHRKARIAAAGTEIPGIGTPSAFYQVYANDGGDVVFEAVLDNGDDVLVLARR